MLLFKINNKRIIALSTFKGMLRRNIEYFLKKCIWTCFLFVCLLVCFFCFLFCFLLFLFVFCFVFLLFFVAFCFIFCCFSLFFVLFFVVFFVFCFVFCCCFFGVFWLQQIFYCFFKKKWNFGIIPFIFTILGKNICSRGQLPQLSKLTILFLKHINLGQTIIFDLCSYFTLRFKKWFLTILLWSL